MKRLLGFLVGAVVGVAAGWGTSALASRDTSGTYTLPYAAVSSGQVISTTWANGTLNDLKTEMSDSLSRSGKGGMNAALKLYTNPSPSPSTPDLYWSATTTTGFYMTASTTPALSVSGTQRQEWTSTGTRLTGIVTGSAGTAPLYTDALSVTSTLSSYPDGLRVSATSTGYGVRAYGGASNGTGLRGTGYLVGHGVWGTGGTATTGTPSGVYGETTSSGGYGVQGTTSATSTTSAGVYGGSSGISATSTPAMMAYSTSGGTALWMHGYIAGDSLGGTTAPNSDMALWLNASSTASGFGGVNYNYGGVVGVMPVMTAFGTRSGAGTVTVPTGTRYCVCGTLGTSGTSVYQCNVSGTTLTITQMSGTGADPVFICLANAVKP